MKKSNDKVQQPPIKQHTIKLSQRELLLLQKFVNTQAPRLNKEEETLRQWLATSREYGVAVPEYMEAEYLDRVKLADLLTRINTMNHT